MKKNLLYGMARVVTGCLCIVCLSAYGYQYQSSRATLDWLGRGFNTATEQIRQTCLTGDWIETGNNEVSMAYLGGRSMRNRVEQTSGSVSGSVNLLIFGGSAKVSMYHRISNDELSVSSVLRIRYDAKDYTLENRHYTALGVEMLTKSVAERIAVCGNTFVHHASLGSDLYVTAKLHFRSRDEYKKYVTKIKIRALFWSKTKTITDIFKQYTKNATYSIKVNSQGGMTPNLKAIMEQNPGYCRTDEMEKCIDTANKLFGYLFSEHGYADELSPEHLTVQQFSVQTYRDSGHYGLDPQIIPQDPGFKFQAQRLQTALATIMKNLQSLEAQLAFASDEQTRETLQNAIASLQQDIAAINSAAGVCENTTSYLDCRNAVNEAQFTSGDITSPQFNGFIVAQ